MESVLINNNDTVFQYTVEANMYALTRIRNGRHSSKIFTPREGRLMKRLGILVRDTESKHRCNRVSDKALDVLNDLRHANTRGY